MAKDKIEITGLMLRNVGESVIVEVEIDGEWHEVIREFSGRIETSFSNIIEPAGMRTAIERGVPYP